MATLYRKYRPQTFGDVIGQDHIRLTLQAAIKQDRLGHAYLFAGPRGVGKTTVARLLAKAINCQNSKDNEPCNECQLCQDITEGRALDVMEIDAASNRGIDDIRELRDKIRFAPTQAKKKVFIIDEVHMLSKDAFNALLKTLEEPPAHAVFVLATTELHKVPVTITSRCQVFSFKKAQDENLISRLDMVAKSEGLIIAAEALNYLARLAGGSYRDALSLLDQVSSVADGNLTLADVQRILGLATEERLLELFDKITAGESETALQRLMEAEAEGVDLDQFAAQLIETGRLLLHLNLKTKLVEKMVTGETLTRWQGIADKWQLREIVEMIQSLVTARQLMKQAVVPSLPLEVAIVKLASRADEPKKSPQPPKEETRLKAPVKIEVEKVITKSQEKPTAVEKTVVSNEPPAEGMVEENEEEAASEDAAPTADEPVVVAAAENTVPVVAATLDNPEEAWKQLLEKIRDKNMSLHGLLSQAQFGGIANKHFVVRVPFQFAADRLSDRKHRQVVEEIIEEMLGDKLALECVIAGQNHLHEVVADTGTTVELADAAEIFGIEEQTVN